MAFAKALKPVRIAQGSPAHWVLRLMGFGAIVYLALSPFFRNLKANEYGQLTDILILGLAATSLNLLVGFTGQISIGHSAFFGLGAYTTAILMHNYGWDPQWTFPMAALLCFAVGVLVGIPALRLTGIYLSLVTLALAQLFPALVRKFDNLTGGLARHPEPSLRPAVVDGPVAARRSTEASGSTRWRSRSWSSATSSCATS